jgi:hypothetical protein
MARKRTRKRLIARKVHSSMSEARDEGPRLIPLDLKEGSANRMDYYLALADAALAWQRKTPKRKDSESNA